MNVTDHPYLAMLAAFGALCFVVFVFSALKANIADQRSYDQDF